ncbi:hypothetical protein [Streptomyces sp. NPDC048669]|uniref:hypothetical protein n=1 Tax=Streptomyces sp. NPDC048669 TaxID=3155267 RepID=UPI0034174143
MFRLVRGTGHIVDVLDVLHRGRLALRIHDGAFSAVDLTDRHPRTGELLSSVKAMVQAALRDQPYREATLDITLTGAGHRVASRRVVSCRVVSCRPRSTDIAAPPWPRTLSGGTGYTSNWPERPPRLEHTSSRTPLTTSTGEGRTSTSRRPCQVDFRK